MIPRATVRSEGPAGIARRAIAALRRALLALLLAPVRAYRYAISPLLPASCRYFPSCSEYAIDALERHGPLAGSWLAVARVCRCHPLNEGGIDPVPDEFSMRPRFARWPAALRGEPPARTE